MLPALLLAACTGKVDEVPVAASTAGPEHCGSITEDEVWAPDLNPHVVTCHVDIDGGTVTIAAGTEVRVQAIKHISVNNADAALEALGTEEDPVVFHADDLEAGTWAGLSFWDGAGGILENTELYDAGYVAYPTIPYVSLRVDGTVVRVENLTIADGVDHGFSLTNGGAFSEDSSGLVSTRNGRPGYGEPDVIGTAVMEGVDLTGNDTDMLVISHGTVTGDAVWEDPGVPYLIGSDGSVGVTDTEGGTARLTIGPGVEVRLDAGFGLGVGTYDGLGALIVEGTEERPVRFTSLTDDDTTYWEGLRLDDGTVDAETVLSNVDIGYGGNGYYNYANIMLVDASPTITGAYLHDSAGYGIYCQGTCSPVLQGVTYANNADGDTNW